MQRKIKKLFSDPRAFINDSKPIVYLKAKLYRKNKNSVKPTAHGLRINEWTRSSIEQRYPEYDWVFYPFKTSAKKVFNSIKSEPINHRIIIWGYNESPDFEKFAVEVGVKLYRMEDGFIRSIGLGANHELPLSLVLDKTGTLYFDARRSSALENLLSDYNFEEDDELISRSKKAIQQLITQKVSKYNHITQRSAEDIYNQFCKQEVHIKRILVIGQVESDASIKYGSDEPLNNGALVWRARLNNPDAQIFFKPHPDTLAGMRPIDTPLETIEKMAFVVKDDLSLSDSFETIDEVYTISSLAGFEALLRGIKVTTLGCPFYSGWGLTNDLQPNHRRMRKLSLEELFAGAYILYPDYFDPFTPKKGSVEDVLTFLSIEKNVLEEEANQSEVQTLDDSESQLKQSKPIAHGIRVNEWKRSFIEERYPEYDWVFYPEGTMPEKVFLSFRGDIENHRIFIWGYQGDLNFETLAAKTGIKLYRIDDSFISSMRLQSIESENLLMTG
jgi:capsule polysaccharide export protein KpsC/LpsZ